MTPTKPLNVRVLAIHHEDWKLYLMRAASRQKHRNLGSLEAVIREAGLGCDYLESGTGRALAGGLERYSHVVVLGGNMSAFDEDSHPFLRQEMQIIEQALARRIPVLGICLGAQLLARVHGARVYPGAHGPELAWHPVSLTDAGRAEPLLRGFAAESPVFQWHYDSFDLPAGAVQLARSAAYEQQAFRIGRSVWAFQFHLEADEHLVRSWLRNYARQAGRSAADLAMVRAATDRHIADYVASARQFMRGFLGVADEAALRPGGLPPAAALRSADAPESAG